MKNSNNLIKRILFVLVLLLFAVLSNGQFAISFAIWISTTMLLFATRNLKKWQGFFLAILIIGTGYYIGFDVVPFIPVDVSIILSVVFSLFAAIPYLIDSFFIKNRGSFLSTLIFPTIAVVIEYAYHQFYPYGSWGHLAYTQESQYVLLQSISVFGMGYITFLITWFAAVANWVYEQRTEWVSIRKGIVSYSAVLSVTLLYGGYRVELQPTNSETVRVASISALEDYAISFSLGSLTTIENKMEAKEQTSRLNQHLFDRSIAEAEAGAKIVFWAEGNGVILKEDEQDLYRKAGQIASSQAIYLGIGVAVLDHTKKRYLENKFVVFDPDGNKVIDYWKAISVPGAEAPISNNKATGIPKVVTDYGTISAAICFDLDFPDYLKGAQGVDILLGPSNDYKEIDPIHTDMAKLRAIEQGFNLIRQTSHGLSTGTDYTGRVISQMDHFVANDKTLITHLPTKGVRTIYSMIGDSFITFCLLIFVLISVSLKSRKAVARHFSRAVATQ